MQQVTQHLNTSDAEFANANAASIRTLQKAQRTKRLQILISYLKATTENILQKENHLGVTEKIVQGIYNRK